MSGIAAGPLRDVIKAIPDVTKALQEHLQNLPDDVVVIEDAVEVASLFVPGLIVIEQLLPVLAWLAGWSTAGTALTWPGSFIVPGPGFQTPIRNENNK
jgi:hypothetical protein